MVCPRVVILITTGSLVIGTGGCPLKRIPWSLCTAFNHNKSGEDIIKSNDPDPCHAKKRRDIIHVRLSISLQFRATAIT